MGTGRALSHLVVHGRHWWLVSLIASVACADVPVVETEGHQDYVINGTTTSDHPAVVVLRSEGGLCTGTLIAPRTVLTAAHCVVSTSGRVPNNGVQVGFGGDQNSAQFIQSVEVRSHSQYSPGGVAAFELPTYDIAVITLASDGPVPPMPLYRQPPQAGQSVTLIGFGVSNGLARSGSGTKRQTSATIARLATQQWQFDAVGGRSVCFGDSGGPALVQTPTGMAVIGVASTVSDNACQSTGQHMRIDQFLDWIGVPEQPVEVTLTGMVVNASSHAPIANATVRVTEQPVNTVAATSGQFSMMLMPGTYTLEASAPGFVTGTNRCTVAAGASCPIGLQAQAPAPTPEITPPPATSMGTAQGVVFDGPTQARVSGATVLVQETGAQMTVQPGTGTWSVELPAGTYTIAAHAPGYQQGIVTCTVSPGQATWCAVPVLPAGAVGADAGLGYIPPADTPIAPPSGTGLDGGCSATGASSSMLWPLLLLLGLRRRR